ncbi:hypothetical protein CICLE_v10003797mg [Citrus x clementina]|uniref:Uncharacterized protein n=1 Tax=Citrus clementina TaxID=85681 RepID=V4TDY8_CITCL|nr:hypothetical protein CICLE_v10003797mg [Citrus x clementina]
MKRRDNKNSDLTKENKILLARIINRICEYPKGISLDNCSIERYGSLLFVMRQKLCNVCVLSVYGNLTLLMRVYC